VEIIADHYTITLDIQEQLLNDTHGMHCCGLADIEILLGLGQRPVQNNNLHLNPPPGN
jgi:hypothetical protein